MRTTITSRHPNVTTPTHLDSRRAVGPSRDFALPVPQTSFVGRDREVTQICEFLGQFDVRLLTLTGPGGVGKSRLALRVGEVASHEFDLGVIFVPLAHIENSALVAPAIGQAFGLGGYGKVMIAERIGSMLSHQSALLLLDNFERVVDAAPFLARLLETSPSLKMMVTSRSLLNLSAEREFAVPPFEMASPDDSLERVARSHSVTLFRQRSHHSTNLLASDLLPEEIQGIGAICRKLDGLPLAIELAAAGTRLMPPADLLSRLDRRLPWLKGGPRDAPERLQTMRNAIAWSYDLLDDQEQDLFRALSVFSGGFTLDAAVAVADADLAPTNDPEDKNSLAMGPADRFQNVFAMLRSLLDQNLIAKRDSSSPHIRFGMLETIREFGRELLVATGGEESALWRHAQFYAASVTPPVPEALTRTFGSRPFDLPGDEDNLRVALAWALDRCDLELAAQLIWILAPFWKQYGFITEARSALDRMLNHADDLEIGLHAGLARQAAELAWFQTDADRALALSTSALDLYQQIGLKAGIAASYHELGSVYKCLDNEVSARYFSQSMELFREIGDERAQIWSLLNLGRAWIGMGDLAKAGQCIQEGFDRIRERTADPTHYSDPPDVLQAWTNFGVSWMAFLEGSLTTAERFCARSLEQFVDSNERYGEGTAHRLLGRIARIKGHLVLASFHLREAYRIARLLGALHCESYCLAEIALVAEIGSKSVEAARLLGAESSIREAIHLKHLPDESAPLTEAEQRARESLGQSRFQVAFDQGRNFSPTNVYDLAMSIVAEKSPENGKPCGLSRREIDVLQLMASSHTNREIAELLFVSKRTVNGHVVSILSKLGVDSRRDAVASARQRGMFDT